jgi:hypothetical protein
MSSPKEESMDPLKDSLSLSLSLSLSTHFISSHRNESMNVEARGSSVASGELGSVFDEKRMMLSYHVFVLLLKSESELDFILLLKEE